MSQLFLATEVIERYEHTHSEDNVMENKRMSNKQKKKKRLKQIDEKERKHNETITIGNTMKRKK